MKKLTYILTIVVFSACNSGTSQNKIIKKMEQSQLKNTKMKDYVFLDCMYRDDYFPKFLVDKCKFILLELCQNIETQKPKNLQELYKLSQASTIKINNLNDEFYDNDSEIETGARECLGANFEYIAKSYDFEADTEELIATRDW